MLRGCCGIRWLCQQKSRGGSSDPALMSPAKRTRSADETAPRQKPGSVPLRVRQLADAHRLPHDIAVHVVDLLLAQTGVGIAIGSGRCGSDRGRAEDAEPHRCRSPAITAPINVAGPPIAVAHHRTATIDTAAIATAAIAAALGVGGLGR